MGVRRSISMAAIAIVLLFGITSAQTSTISIPFMGFNFDAVDASVVTVQDERTTLALNCPPGPSSTNCGVYATETVVTGPSTYSLVLTDPAALSFTQACVPSGASPFSTYSCQESADGTKVQGGPSSSTTTHTDDVTYVPITVTAGAALLGGGATPTAAITTGGNNTSSTSVIGSTASTSTCSVSGQITQCSGITTSAGSGTSVDSSMSSVSTASGQPSAASQTSNAAASTSQSLMNKAVGLLAFPLFLL